MLKCSNLVKEKDCLNTWWLQPLTSINWNNLLWKVQLPSGIIAFCRNVYFLSLSYLLPFWIQFNHYLFRIFLEVSFGFCLLFAFFCWEKPLYSQTNTVQESPMITKLELTCMWVDVDSLRTWHPHTCSSSQTNFLLAQRHKLKSVLSWQDDEVVLQCVACIQKENRKFCLAAEGLGNRLCYLEPTSEAKVGWLQHWRHLNLKKKMFLWNPDAWYWSEAALLRVMHLIWLNLFSLHFHNKPYGHAHIH